MANCYYLGFGKYDAFNDIKIKALEEVTFASIKQMRSDRIAKRSKLQLNKTTKCKEVIY